MGLFRNKKKVEIEVKKDVKTAALKSIDYHPKIILAWAKVIEGNQELSNWLKENGFPELVIATSAIYLKTDARDWLIQNGYAHLMAMIHAAEGDEKAQKWLKKYKFEMLYHIAMAVEHENESWIWLKKHTSPDVIILTTAIRKVKDKIEENHNDIHSFRRDT
jgi:hypothetical protein